MAQQTTTEIITRVANELGVPVNLALAIAQQESGLNPNAIGDGGHSVGVFQLNDQGEGHGLSVGQREDVETNARIALTQVKNVMKEHPDWSGGQIAAAAQRPADQVGYANSINAALGDKSASIATSQQLLSGASLTQYVQQNYPQYAYILNNPEVGPILIKAAQQGVVDPNVLQGMLQGTKWWQTTSATARQFNEQLAEDPANMAQAITNEQHAINLQAQQMGVTLTADQTNNLATNYLKLGQSPQDLQQAIAALWKYQPGGTQTGAAGTDTQTLKALYAEYALPVSDATLGSQLQKVLAGQQTTDDIKAQIAQSAQSLYGNNPDLASALKAGQTVKDYMTPFADMAATKLGVDPASINWLDPKWNQALTGTVDPASGRTTPMSLAQWTTKIMTDQTYGWNTSLDGIQTGTQIAAGLQQRLNGGTQ